ncbi:MAG: flippase-like domain-containing protein, partial [Anaerolineales bacterium]|nr:flippase-like domain-containing protein [Anaerolineales bacterium]
MIAAIRANWRRLAPGLLVSAVALGVIFYLIDLERFLEALRLADYRYVILLFGITLVWLAVRSLAWRTLLSEQARYGQVFLTLNEGYLLNNVLPLRLGEVGR